MPELPDLVYIEKKLRPVVLDREIKEASLWEPIVLRMGVAGSFAETLPGKTITGLRRHGPFLVFNLPPLEMIVHFMLAGFFRVDTGDSKKPRTQSSVGRLNKAHCFSLELDDRLSLHYFDSRRMGKIYVVETEATAGIPGFDTQGTDVLSADLTLQVFKDKIAGRRHQVRVFLMDQSLLSAIGNAYADEILFAARIHPKTGCNQLGEEDIERLYSSLRAVLNSGIEEVQKAAQPIDVKVRGHLKVRNRRGEPCPVCGTTIRRAGVLGYDSFFCPKCQPERRSRLVSWDKLS
jgi:formamidopyrimidine-DNA glycosylase